MSSNSTFRRSVPSARVRMKASFDILAQAILRVLIGDTPAAEASPGTFPLVTMSNVVIIQEYYSRDFRVSGASPLSAFSAISFLFLNFRPRHIQTQLHNVLTSLRHSMLCFRLFPGHQVHWREDAFLSPRTRLSPAIISSSVIFAVHFGANLTNSNVLTRNLTAYLPYLVFRTTNIQSCNP
jgi:hypothetical protein